VLPRVEQLASASLHTVEEGTEFRIVLALDALPAIKLIEADLDFPNERRAAQFANVLIPFDPLRECKPITRRKFGGLGFEFSTFMAGE